ncbi:hypothetical protein MMC09_004639 [Bachmanniomyces sp. S44760]|nr:hypothetical protein [Bachmanniomyces sp. S44760]
MFQSRTLTAWLFVLLTFVFFSAVFATPTFPKKTPRGELRPGDVFDLSEAQEHDRETFEEAFGDMMALIKAGQYTDNPVYEQFFQQVSDPSKTAIWKDHRKQLHGAFEYLSLKSSTGRPNYGKIKVLRGHATAPYTAKYVGVTINKKGLAIMLTRDGMGGMLLKDVTQRHLIEFDATMFTLGGLLLHAIL